MTRTEFRTLIAKSPVLLDGACAAGCDARGCPEKRALEHFDAVASQLSAYKDAGSRIIRCPTSGANRFRLDSFGLASETKEINRELMRRCRETLGDTCVFGTCSTTGKMIEPFGELDFDEAVACFGQQGRALVEGGADGFIIETMADIQQARAALIALRELGDFPVMVHMVFGSKKRTANGTDPLTAVITLQALGADSVGFGLYEGAAALAATIENVKPYATVPLFAFLSAAGVSADVFASEGKELVRSGANLLGGDAAASPDHIESLGNRIHAIPYQGPAVKSISALSSVGSTVMVGRNHPFAVVGERINPTGKKKLQANLRECSLAMVELYATEQQQRKASVLDVNMGLSGIDEMVMMLRSVHLLSRLSPLPLCIDTTRPEVVKAALRRYPGRALVNSVSGEKERIEYTLPAAAKYGAMFIALPLTDAGIPATVNERIEVINVIMQAADPFGITVDDIVVDGLVMTISSNPKAATDTLDLISWCSDSLRSNTICGLSNVSFGMPERQWINGAFLGMAMGRGLTMAIANPSSDSIMATVQAHDSLMGHNVEMLARRGVFAGK
jgi:5-methyltetrahydrofolate--homocysteine methyltransferase